MFCWQDKHSSVLNYNYAVFCPADLIYNIVNSIYYKELRLWVKVAENKWWIGSLRTIWPRQGLKMDCILDQNQAYCLPVCVLSLRSRPSSQWMTTVTTCSLPVSSLSGCSACCAMTSLQVTSSSKKYIQTLEIERSDPRLLKTFVGPPFSGAVLFAKFKITVFDCFFSVECSVLKFNFFHVPKEHGLHQHFCCLLCEK